VPARANRAKRTQFPARRRRPIVQNEPNLVGSNVQNEPNWAALAGRAGVAGAVAIGAKRAKQTQFGPHQGEGQVVCGKGVMTQRTCKEHWKNKANSRAGGEGTRAGTVDCAKRTQFGRVSGGTPNPRRAGSQSCKRSQFPAGPETRGGGPDVRNEASCRPHAIEISGNFPLALDVTEKV
jgi:hypothetical protein